MYMSPLINKILTRGWASKCPISAEKPTGKSDFLLRRPSRRISSWRLPSMVAKQVIKLQLMVKPHAVARGLRLVALSQ